MIDVLYDYRYRQRGPRVVAVGGGTGMSILLRGLKEYTGNLTAIFTVADDGGSSGRLRTDYSIPPPGDVRQCLTALAEAEPLMKQLFQHRFSGGGLDGHSFGNLFITAMAQVTGNFERAVQEAGKVLAVRGQILASTLQDVRLCAEFKDAVGSPNGAVAVVVGESSIPDHAGSISRVFLDPVRPELNPEAALSILDCDLIVIGPGSLYTSLLPNLLVDGMVDVIKAARAPKVYVCNVADQRGETDGFTVSDHLRVLHDHVGVNLFDYVLVNSNHAHEPTGGQNKVIFDPVAADQFQAHFVLADVVNRRVPSHHDSEKLAKVIIKRIWNA